MGYYKSLPGGYKIDMFEEIGRGAFGTVYKGCNRFGETVAIKMISKKNRSNASKESVIFRNLKTLSPHDHIIEVYDVKTYKESMCIMMDYCDLGDLRQVFKIRNAYCQQFAVKIQLMKEIIAGIAFLHSKKIVHRDIKPGNILLKSTTPCGQIIVKLGDFGLSKFLDPNSNTSAMSSDVGTFIFKAPEFFDFDESDKVRYHTNVDVYSAGLTFTAMLQARPNEKLVPKAEGSLSLNERNMVIGLAAHTRMVYHQPEFNVVENKPEDKEVPKMKVVKELIRGMTCAYPQRRLSSKIVEQKLNGIVEVSYMIILCGYNGSQ